MSYQYDERDWAPMSHFQKTECEGCGAEFWALGTPPPATREEPGDFETDETLCDECECKEK